MWARSPKLALSRRTLHYPRVDLDKHWNDCGHDRPSWHYLGLPFTIQKWIWTNICKVDILQNGIGPILGNVGYIRSGFWTKIAQSGHYRMWIWTKIGQSGDYRALKLSKVGTIVAKFGPKLSKVGIIGAQIGPSGHYRGWMWSKGEFGHPIVW